MNVDHIETNKTNYKTSRNASIIVGTSFHESTFLQHNTNSEESEQRKQVE